MTTDATFAADERPRPAGLPEPPTEELRQIDETIRSERFTEALEALFDVTPRSLDEVAWTRYLRGSAMFGNGEYEAGLDEFALVLNHTDAIDRSEQHREAFRIAGLCLKKTGWHARRREQYSQAYDLHLRRYDLAERYGSFAELHDAAISLDVDCYHLKNPASSEEWLRKSLKAARQIPDEHLRDQALATSWNNLAATLTTLKRFEEAETAAKSSVEHWSAWENAEGSTKEHRVVWSHYGLAEVYREWAETDKTKRELALAEYEQAFALGNEQGLSEADRKIIQEKIDSLK